MTRSLFLIGPSRIGKSTAGGFVAERLERVRHNDLDGDIKPFRKPDVDPVVTAQDWDVLEPVLGSYESAPVDLAITDIGAGAGTQSMVEYGRREIFDWLARPSAFVVLLTADSLFAWGRWIDGRPEMEAQGFDRFLQQEFTGRQELYGLAQRTIDVTKRLPDDVGEELLGIAAWLNSQTQLPVDHAGPASAHTSPDAFMTETWTVGLSSSRRCGLARIARGARSRTARFDRSGSA